MTIGGFVPAETAIRSNAYRRAQHAVAALKASVHDLLLVANTEGLTNSEVGRRLGIYQGHVGHEGHISRTILQMLQAEGVVEQTGPRGRWRILADQGRPNDSSE